MVVEKHKLFFYLVTGGCILRFSSIAASKYSILLFYLLHQTSYFVIIIFYVGVLQSQVQHPFKVELMIPAWADNPFQALKEQMRHGVTIPVSQWCRVLLKVEVLLTLRHRRSWQAFKRLILMEVRDRAMAEYIGIEDNKTYSSI